ncbi:MAG: hypothetical protein GY928_02290 [Colwellia sp.]|nr:hypothetical protein [Colwellia sp.]
MNDYLTDELQSIFRLVLSGKDYIKAANNSKMSFSTVNNIVNKRTKITVNNIYAYKALLGLALENIDGFNEFKSIIKKELK